MAEPTGAGYAAYEVAANVTNHEIWGGGCPCFFTTNLAVEADRASEVPQALGVRAHGLLTVSLGDIGAISIVINGVSGAVPTSAGNTATNRLASYN